MFRARCSTSNENRLAKIRTFATVLIALAMLAALLGWAPASASSRRFVQSSLSSQGATENAPPAQVGETIRSKLTQAQVALATDKATAQKLLFEARAAYDEPFARALAAASTDAARRISAGFASAENALTVGDASGFAAARAEIWTALLDGAYKGVQAALEAGDGRAAQRWLFLREFRTATRFSRPNADATLAVAGVIAGTVASGDALLAVRADLLDTYQARMSEALHDIPALHLQGFATRRVEKAALASGYFALLSDAYREQRGAGVLAGAQEAFTDLLTATRAGVDPSVALRAVESTLEGFRAAPLSMAEQVRRAGQLRRFLALVPVEYARGVRDGKITVDLEIQEAITFHNGAMAAFADLQDLLRTRDAARTSQAEELLDKLESMLAEASSRTAVSAPEEVQATTDQALLLLGEVMPPEWQQHDSSADFDVISSILDQMETAAAAGQYDQAESARLEAYAMLESGPEARLIAFAPELVTPIEDLFWYGQGEHKGLAYLIREHSSLGEIKATRDALDILLAQAAEVTKGNNAPLAVAANAAIIVFREGLEAVLILASLLASLKQGANRKFRRPLWWGAIGALGATVLTWLLARGLLSAMARFGEALEAVVSLIAIGVLLLITNWFFHKVYWTGWIANFHSKKKRLIGGETGQILGLVALGFTSIYREGFETVLFLQALVLEAGAGAVLGGIALGLAGTALVGIVVFALQAKLPYKKMLVVTGVMIGGVLLVMVGNTVHVLQVVGWLPIHPLPGVSLPYWAGMWLGLYATWEGILFQVAAATFVIGSYFLAEHRRDRRVEAPKRETRPSQVKQA